MVKYFFDIQWGRNANIDRKANNFAGFCGVIFTLVVKLLIDDPPRLGELRLLSLAILIGLALSIVFSLLAGGAYDFAIPKPPYFEELQGVETVEKLRKDILRSYKENKKINQKKGRFLKSSYKIFGTSLILLLIVIILRMYEIK